MRISDWSSDVCSSDLPKSNATYAAWDQAKAFVKRSGSQPVPLHLRNAPTKLMKQMGYHEGYRYAHDEPNGYAAGQTYFPEGVARPGWYQPTDRSEEHTSELQSLMRISYAVFCVKKKN